MIGTDVLTVCNAYFILVDLVECCKRLITSFNGGFLTVTGERRIDFSIESDDLSISAGIWSFVSSISSSFKSQILLSSSLNNG